MSRKCGPPRFAFTADESVGNLLVHSLQRVICCMRGGTLLFVTFVPPLNPGFTSATAHGRIWWGQGPGTLCGRISSNSWLLNIEQMLFLRDLTVGFLPTLTAWDFFSRVVYCPCSLKLLDPSINVSFTRSFIIVILSTKLPDAMFIAISLQFSQHTEHFCSSVKGIVVGVLVLLSSQLSK